MEDSLVMVPATELETFRTNSSWGGFNIQPLTTVAATATEHSMGYATFSSKYATVVPQGAQATAVCVENGQLIMNWGYQAGNIIPANTGVLVRIERAQLGQPLNFATTHNQATGTIVENNLLRPSHIAMSEEDANYKLSRSKADVEESGDNYHALGFYWGAEDGLTFQIAEGKAYLAIPRTNVNASLQSLVLPGIDETTEIMQPTVDADGEAAAPTFDIMGRRVDVNVKGLLIRSGKKYIAK